MGCEKSGEHSVSSPRTEPHDLDRSLNLAILNPVHLVDSSRSAPHPSYQGSIRYDIGMSNSPDNIELIARAKGGSQADLEALCQHVRAILEARLVDDSSRDITARPHPIASNIDQAMVVLTQQISAFSGTTEKELVQWLDRQLDQINADPRPDDETLHGQATLVVRTGDLEDPNQTLGRSDKAMRENVTDAPSPSDLTVGRSDETQHVKKTDKHASPAQADTIGRADVTLNRPLHEQVTLDATNMVNQGVATGGAEAKGSHSESDGGRPFGDYELLDLIAKGGMGVVYRARQRKLNRIVALKMILAGQFADEVDVKRFYGEAEAAARLRHRNIVGIHEVGECEGQHFFSMEFIDGQSLSQLVRENPLPPNQAAMIVQDIAAAMQYAHEQDILHRDLKPSNVLLDESNEPMITDFGLAKQVEGQSQLTMSGAIVGTPSYMPPEQASAQTDKVGVRSDVYSTGAILYELLTGTPPFRAATPFETIRQVLEREPISPRVVNSSIPVDLETICLKCLQKDPAARYATSQELADELRRFLAGEPIQARPISAIHRVWRWCKKNKVVSGISAAAVLLLCAFIVSLMIYASTSQRLLAKADHALEETLSSVNELFVIVSESRLLNEPGAKQLREDLLLKARNIYQRIHERQSDAPRIRHQLALSHYRVGRIMEELRSPDQAKQAYDKALSMQLQLITENPDNLEYLYDLSNTQNFLGRLEGGSMENPEQGLNWFEEVKRNRIELVRRAKDSAEYRRKLASVYMSCGLLMMKMGKSDLAKVEFDTAQEKRAALREQLLTRLKDGSIPQQESLDRRKTLILVNEDLAMGYHNLGMLAMQSMEKSLAALERETQKRKKGGKSDKDKLKTHVANAVRFRKRCIAHHQDSDKALGRAIEADKENLENKYRRAVFRRALGDAHNSEVIEELGKKDENGEDLVIEHAIGNLDEVLKHYEQAQTILQELVQENPRSSNYRSALAGLQAPSLARLYCDLGKVKLGFATFDKATKHFERLSQTIGSVPRYRFDLAKTHRGVGEQHTVTAEQMELRAKIADWEKPLKSFQQSKAILTKLCIDDPKKTSYKTELNGVNQDIVDIALAIHDVGLQTAGLLKKQKQVKPNDWDRPLLWLSKSKTILVQVRDEAKTKKVRDGIEKLLEHLDKDLAKLRKSKGG